MSDAREKKRSLQSRILNLSKTSPKSPKLPEFQRELRSLAHETHESEMDLADFKRFALKEAFYLRFNAMNEYAEKTALIAGFGKYLTDLIEIEPTPPTQQHRNPYEKGPEAAIIFADAMNAVNDWKPKAADERPTLANTDIVDVGKGKEPEGTPAQKPTPPELPPRQPSLESIVVNQPVGYTTDEVSNATGDLKIAHENEIDLDKIDLYDAPPPAYDDPPKHISSPLNSDHLTAQHQDSYTFSSPYQTNANLPPAPQPQHQQYHQIFESPAPMHQQAPYQHLNHYQHQDSTFYDPTNVMYNTQVNYQQLYRQVSQRRQPAAYRPYSEFQQQFNQTYSEGHHILRQKVDAGGFRIPAPAPAQDSAEDEKERLAQHYREQEQQQQYTQSQYGGSQYDGAPHYDGAPRYDDAPQYDSASQYNYGASQYDHGSHYAASQYGGSQYAGSQYEGSQYGGLAGTPNQHLQPQNSIQKTLPTTSPQQSPQVQPASLSHNQELQKPNYEQKTQEETD